jgi:hypothetical protein
LNSSAPRWENETIKKMRGTLALTPALSPKERVNPSPACCRYERDGWSCRCRNKTQGGAGCNGDGQSVKSWTMSPPRLGQRVGVGEFSKLKFAAQLRNGISGGGRSASRTNARTLAFGGLAHSQRRCARGAAHSSRAAGLPR